MESNHQLQKGAKIRNKKDTNNQKKEPRSERVPRYILCNSYSRLNELVVHKRNVCKKNRSLS